MRRPAALDPWLGAALALGFALRCIQPLVWPVFDCFADECTYLQIAAALPSEDGVVEPGGADRWLWAPGYPYLLFALRETVGSPFAIRWLQLLLDLGAIAAVYSLARRFAPADTERRSARAAALLYAAHPTLVFYSGRLWSEGVFAPMLLFAVAAAAWCRGGGWRRAVLAGGLLGGCVLLRGVAFYMLPLFAVAVAWPDRGAGAAWGRGLALAGTSLLIVAPYSILASQRYDGVVVSDATLGRLMWQGNNDFPPITFDYGVGITREQGDRFARAFEAPHRPTCLSAQAGANLDPVAIDRCEVRAGLAWIAAHKAEFAARIPVRLAHFANPHSFLTRHVRMHNLPGLSPAAGEILVWWVMIASWVVLLGGAVGAVARASGPVGGLTVGLVVFQVAAVAALVGLTRYRVPVVVLLIPFAGLVVASPRGVWRELRAHPTRAFACAATLAVAVPLCVWHAPAGFA